MDRDTDTDWYMDRDTDRNIDRKTNRNIDRDTDTAVSTAMSTDEHGQGQEHGHAYTCK